MSYYVNMFLSKELTCVPQYMEKYVGRYYTNTAGNAITWSFLVWNILHYLFDYNLENLLRKMLFKTHQRQRLLRALWLCGFCSTGLVFCVATLFRNNMNILEFQKGLPIDGGPVLPHITIGLGLFGTFFIHLCFWDLIRYGFEASSVSNFLLAVLPVFAYTTRRIELFLTLLAFISFTTFMFNSLRCLAANLKNSRSAVLLMQGVLYVSLTIYALVQIIMVPLILIVPFIYDLFKNPVNLQVIIFASLLTAWWLAEIVQSPLYKFLQHWIWINHSNEKKICVLTLIDCTLFGPRDDVAYNLQIIRKEIKERQEKMISRRKPKNRGMLIQTLKCTYMKDLVTSKRIIENTFSVGCCVPQNSDLSNLGMVAIKRKLKNKRNSECSEESDSDSEKKDNNSDEESSSDENSEEMEEEAKKEADEYQEETARALLEDQEDRMLGTVGLEENKKND